MSLPVVIPSTRKIARLVQRGLYCTHFEARGPIAVPVFKSKHNKARSQRFAAKMRKRA